MNETIVFENELCRLTVGADCLVKSLVIKKNGTECVRGDEETALFSATQERPFKNETKQTYPNKKTEYRANAVVRKGDVLTVGFENAPYKATVRVKEARSYIAFTLEGFIASIDDDYGGLTMDVPPVTEFRLIQLPVIDREHFGEWLNASWDDAAAINVLATSPHARIDAERRHGYRVMTADAVRGIKLAGCSAALIAAPGKDALLQAIAELEEDYGLPRGVESRKNKALLNRSAYWTYDINPENVDEHIEYAKRGGFRMMLIYFSALYRDCEGGGYDYCGDYVYSDKYPEGGASLEKMLDKIKAAGITPGFHVLHTHIGLKSAYVRPRLDKRINLTRHFTLARPLSKSDDVIYVDQNPDGCVMHPKCRYLNFGGEMIGYEGYTTERPYRFFGCTRGANGEAREHAEGAYGGLVDITEFGATSAYIDQNTDLQDEIAKKLADAYDRGFEYLYFDGAEGTNAPFDFHVPNAEYRILKHLKTEPLFNEGAAKAHFSWHFLAGGNAFDAYAPNIFKKSIDEFPAKAAERMKNDFTRTNFGWWRYNGSYQPDMYEYGTAKAAAWDCPGTLMAYVSEFKKAPRTGDTLEIMRRWEDVRARELLTEEDKLALREPGREYHLLINEEGEYELVPYTEITCRESEISAFSFTRRGNSYVVFWHKSGEAKAELPLAADKIKLFKSFGGDGQEVTATKGGATIAVGDRAYIEAALDESALRAMFENAKLV